MSTYVRPASVAEALSALAEGGESARLIAGGTDLLVGLRHHLIDPACIVDLKHVTDLPAPIVVTEDEVRIGPTFTMAELVDDKVIQDWFPGLVEAAAAVGSLAIRNRATLIANQCNGSPAADTAPSLLVLGARARIASLEGEREVELRDFFLSPRRTLCAPGEIVTELTVPRPPDGSGSASLRLTRRRGVDIATVSVAARVDDDGSFLLGLGAVGPKPHLTERSTPIDPSDTSGIAAEVERLLAIATPISDVRASAEYRASTLRVLARRAVQKAGERRNPKERAA